MDEVLSFRNEHFKEHRAYVQRSVRKLTRDLALLPADEREEGLKDRREESEGMETASGFHAIDLFRQHIIPRSLILHPALKTTVIGIRELLLAIENAAFSLCALLHGSNGAHEST